MKKRKAISLAGPIPDIAFVFHGPPLRTIGWNKATVSCGNKVLGKVVGVVTYPDGSMDIQIERRKLHSVNSF